MPYSILEHRHRFAAWAAARAASVNGCRFTVQQGKAILEQSGLREVLGGVRCLPSPDQVDVLHRKWRRSVVVAAKRQGFQVTHGVAAKLINIYLKAGFVCGGHHDHSRVRAMHPPIDSLLLDSLWRANVGGFRSEWDVARKAKWSKFTSAEYEVVIRTIRLSMKGGSLWRVEEHWRGFK